MWIKIKEVTNDDYYRNKETIINTNNIAYIDSYFDVGARNDCYYVVCGYNGDNTKTFKVYERYYRAIERFLLTGQYEEPKDTNEQDPVFQLIDLIKKDYVK